MKILHTADWHVGKTLRGRDRGTEHEAVLKEIGDLARSEAVDLVLVAGDLFDSAAPSPDAERIVYSSLLDLASTGAQVAVVPGNHDNERRLAAVAPLLASCGVRACPFVVRAEEGGVVELHARGGEKVRLAFVPFLSQRYAVRAVDLMEEGAAEHVQRYADRVRKVVGTLADQFSADAVNVILAHLTIVGGELGGGERQAQTVFDYWVDPSAFPTSCHYVALGHLHRPQRILGPCPIWYSGSPLQLDFGEGGDAKAVLIVEASPGSPAEVREVPLTGGRRLRTVRGTFAEIERLAGTTGDEYLRVFVREKARAGLANEVREMFPEAVDVIIDPEEREDQTQEASSRAGRSPHELFVEYLAEQGVSDEQLFRLFDRLLEEELHATSST